MKTQNMIVWNFGLLPEEQKRARAFIDKHEGKGCFRFTFTNTQIGMHVEITNEKYINGEKVIETLDISDYDSW